MPPQHEQFTLQNLIFSLTRRNRPSNRLAIFILLMAFAFTAAILFVYEYHHNKGASTFSVGLGTAPSSSPVSNHQTTNGGNIHVSVPDTGKSLANHGEVEDGDKEEKEEKEEGKVKNPGNLDLQIEFDNIQMSKLNGSEYAYVFYATSYAYACSALVNIQRLLHHPSIKTRVKNVIIYVPKVSDFSVVTVDGDEFSNTLETHRSVMNIKKKFESLGVYVIQEDPPNFLKNPTDYYKDVLLKLSTFSIYKHFPQLKRIIVLDSDQLILQNLDHLFFLPSVPLAAPRAYWGADEGHQWITSTLMVIQPSEDNWNRVLSRMKAMKEGEYDMEVVNKVFVQEVLVLPGRYCTLNSHWEVKDWPKWWRPRGPLWEEIFPNEKSSKKTSGAERKAGKDGQKGPPAATSTHSSNPTFAHYDDIPKLLPPKDSLPISYLSTLNFTSLSTPSGPNSNNRPAILDPLTLLLFNPLDPSSSAAVVHFTALGKPWSYTMDEARDRKRQAHWGFLELWRAWREEGMAICEGWLSVV